MLNISIRRHFVSKSRPPLARVGAKTIYTGEEKHRLIGSNPAGTPVDDVREFVESIHLNVVSVVSDRGRLRVAVDAVRPVNAVGAICGMLVLFLRARNDHSVKEVVDGVGTPEVVVD